MSCIRHGERHGRDEGRCRRAVAEGWLPLITGRQIHEARLLLGLKRSTLAQKVGRITTLAIMRAEESEDEPMLTLEQATAVQRVLERAGVEFMIDGPRLREDQPPDASPLTARCRAVSRGGVDDEPREAVMTDRYADADPEEFVVVVGLGPMTLQTAVRMWAAASKVPGVLIAPVAREASKDPATFKADDLDRLAEMERFH